MGSDSSGACTWRRRSQHDVVSCHYSTLIVLFLLVLFLLVLFLFRRLPCTEWSWNVFLGLLQNTRYSKFLIAATTTLTILISHLVLLVLLFETLCGFWSFFYMLKFGKVVFLSRHSDINKNAFDVEFNVYLNALNGKNRHLWRWPDDSVNL